MTIVFEILEKPQYLPILLIFWPKMEKDAFQKDWDLLILRIYSPLTQHKILKQFNEPIMRN